MNKQLQLKKIEDLEFVQETIQFLTKVYKSEVDSGLLEIIVPPKEFYPDLDALGYDKVFNDSNQRVKWRTKQNYDFSYLMTYAQKRGSYYLQVCFSTITSHLYYYFFMISPGKVGHLILT